MHGTGILNQVVPSSNNNNHLCIAPITAKEVFSQCTDVPLNFILTLNYTATNITSPEPTVKKESIMTRSHKQNERDHAALAAGTSSASDRLPRFFGKSGLAGTDPKKIKKNGAGKGGWGVEGEEIQDSNFSLSNARRRSNSSSYASGLKDFKTKFEDVETEPVFEESIHGAQYEGPGSPTSTHSDNAFAGGIEKVNTFSSESSVDEEEKSKKL